MMTNLGTLVVLKTFQKLVEYDSFYWMDDFRNTTNQIILMEHSFDSSFDCSSDFL